MPWVWGNMVRVTKKHVEHAQSDVVNMVIAHVMRGADSGARGAILAHWSHRFWLPLGALQRFPDAEWDWKALSANEYAIPLQFVRDTATAYPWSWADVSSRKSLKHHDIVSFPEIPWDVGILRVRNLLEPPCQSPEDDEDDDRRTIALINQAARSGTLDPEVVRRNMHLPLDFQELSCCPVLHDLAIEFPNHGWNWTRVSIYATIDRFIEHPRLFDPRFMLSSNLSDGYLRRLTAAITLQTAVRGYLARREMSSRRIQRAWMQAAYNPDMRLCRARMQRMARKWNMACDHAVSNKRGRDPERECSASSKRHRVCDDTVIFDGLV